MANILDTLRERRTLFNEFTAATLPPELLKQEQEGQLSLSEIAQRISNPEVRKKYRELAIAMLEANVAFYQPNATKQAIASPHSSFVIASTLIFAGIVQYLLGTAAALIAAGICYGLGSRAAVYRANQLSREAEVHNSQVGDWAHTLKEWEVERDKLRAIGT